MFLSCPNASAVQSISHEGKVVLVATVTSDGVSSLRYSVKQDGFEQTALQNPLGSGWESFKPLPLPTDSIGDASVEQWEARELSDSEGRPLLRSLYRSAQLTADAPVQLISHDGAIHVFRQSRRGTLLVDRFVLDGMTNTLNPKYEVRYKRSRQRLAPSKSMKQRPDGQLESLDGLDFRDMQNQFFTEPSIEICAPLTEGIRDGNFAVVVVPTTEPDHYRWHIFHANAGDSQVQCLSLRSGEDQVFSLYDYTKTSLDPLTNTTTYTLLHGVIQRSIALVSTRGQSLRVTNGLAAVLYDVQREQQTAAGPQLLLDATKLMLAVPTDAGVMALNFALAADGTLARISADSTETILRSKQREVLLPLSVMDEIRAVGDATPAPGGTIQAISRSTGDSNADRVRVSVADGEQAQLERLRKGDVVRLFNTTTYNGLYAVRSVDNGAFCIDAPFRYDDVGEWEKVEEEDNGLVFDGLITAYEKTGDGVVKVEAVNHGLLAGDLVQIVESPDVGGEYQILERDAQGFTVQRLWGSAEAVNVKIAMRKRRGLVFDGKSDGIRAELATTVHLAKGFTLETWVKLSRSGNQTLVATVPESPAPGVAQRCWQALLGIKAGKLNVTYRPINLGATEAVSLSAKQKAPLQEWLHVACSFDGEQLRLMQNGKEVASLAGSALEQAAAAGHAALLEALTADANQAAADLSTSGLPADHPCNYLAGRWVCRSSEQLLTPEDGGTAALGWPSEQLQQSWTVERQAPDRFSLRHSGSGQVLNHGGRLVRWQNKPDQLWSLRAAGGGWYQLCSPESNQVLAADGSQVRLVVAESSAGDTSEQLWRFDPIGATKVNIAQTALAAARLLAPRPGQGIPVAVAALTMAGHEEAGSWKAPFQGQLSDLRFWDSGRPAQQVSHAMHLQMLGRERGLLGSWRLGGVASDDDGVQRVFDFSVNANHGVVRGAPYDGGILLGRTLRDQTTAAVMFSNGDLVAVSEGAIYVESFEFRTDPSLDPRNADGKQGAIFAPSLWGRSSRGAEEKQAITATQEGFQFEELGEGWWRASSRFVIPQGVRLLRCFELAQVRGSWSTLELRRHGLNLVSDTVTLSLADEQAQLSLASGEAALALGQEDMAAQLAKAEQTAKAALEMAALSQSQLEKEKADPRHFTRINLVQDSDQKLPVVAGSYKAVSFNPKTKDCITLPPEALPTGPEITISFWLSSSGEAPLQNSVIVAFDKSNNRTLWISLPWSDGYVHFDCGNANTDRWDRLSKEINLDSVKGIWTHWAFTKNTVTGVMRIIRNGEVWAESKGNMRSMAQAVNLCVGAAKAEKPFLSGEVDQLQIWSRERSPLEIQASMRQSPRNDEAGLCGYWQGFAGRFIDLSPAQRHGTLCGAPSWVTSVLGSAQPGLATEALPDFMTSPEGQWEALLQTDQSGALSGRFRLCGAKVNAVFLGRLAAVGGERPSLLDHSDPERNRWILEPSHTSGSYRLRAPGEPLAYLGWSNNYTFKTPASFLRFDGRQDYVEVPFKTGVHDLKVFTVAFWVRFEKGLFGSPLTCRSQPSGAGLSGYMFYVDQNHQVQFSVGRSSDWLTVFSSKLSPNTWVHVCGSYDGQAIRLYVNGELSGSQNCTDYRPNVAAANRPLRLGAGSTESTPNHFLKGDVAEVSLWNQPLNSPQIKAFMNRSLSGREPALVAYYPLSALDTIAGKERCLVDRAGLNPGQVVGGRPQLITADERSSGYRLDPGFQSLGLGSTPMAFQLKPVAGTETPAGAQQIQAAAVNYAAAEAEATQAAEQLAELRAMFDLLAELGFTSPAGKTTSFPPLADLLPPLAAAESREAELVSRMKWLKIAIGQLSDIDKLRLDLSAQVIVTDQHLRDLERAKNWLREERNDTSNYWGVLLIGVDSGRYMVTHQDSLRPTWGKKACLGIDDEGATIEVDHSNFARGWWQVQKLVGNTWTTVNSRDRSGGFALFNPSPASNGGQLLCSVPWPREIILAGGGEVRSAINRLFTVNTFGRDGGELVEIQALNGGYIGASNHEWNGSLVWTDVRGCLFRMIGSPGTEHAEGASRIQHRRSLVKARTQKYNDARSCLEELTIRLDSQSKLLLAYQRELTDVTEQLAGQLKRIQMLRSIYLTRLSASQSEAQVLPALPEQEDPRGLIVQGGVIPFPRAASRLTASAGCHGIVSFLYHDPRANLVRARYDTAYDADGRGEEWIPDGFHAALALEGTRSIVGLPAALFRPLNQQITLEFWARCDSSHPNEVVFLVALDRQNRPLLRIQLPNAKEEVVWEAGANPSDGSLDRLSCSVPASLYREAWTHWAFVKDAERGEMHIYANGQILASHIPEAGGAKPLQQPLGGICRAALGGAPGASQAWQGQISELRLWNRALSPRTIESNSVLTLAGNEPGLLAYYPLNEASGEFARDHSGQGFSMRITGASWVPCTAPMGRLPEQQPTALIRDMTPLAGKQPLALPPVGLQGGGFSLGMRLRVEAFLPTTTLVELSTEDQSDVLSMGYLPAKQLWTLQQRVKGVVHSLEFKLELKTNDWVHLAFTISAKGEVLAYRNGVAVGSGLLPLPGPGLRTANVAGGANAGAASAYPARIEHLRVWDKALSRWEIARQALHAPGFGHAVLAEYSRVVIDAQKRKNAMMMRCLAIANSDGIALLDEQWIENLEMKWVGNTQINPTLIGYIEGAPPIPSENLTEEDDYNGATSVELVQSSDVAYSWTREQDVSLGAEIEVLLGAQSETTAGTPFVQTTLEEVKTGLGAKFDFAYHWQNSSTVEASSSLSQSDRLELRGCQEEAPRFPHLGRRFIPKNVGYALVTSGLADVFVSRLSRSGRMVGYQVLPVEGMPPDVNTITFLMNPAYTMAGSLDGLTGSAPTSQRFHRHVPGMRAQYGSLYPASYYRLQEAYNLKAEIDKRDQQRQAYFNQFNAGLVDETSLTRNINAGPEPDPVGSPGGSIAVGADDTSPEMKELDAKIAAKKAQIELAENSGKSEDTQRVPLLKAEEIALQKQRSDLSTKEQESRKKEGAARQHEIDAKHKDLSARAHATDSFASWQRTMENLQIRAAKRNIVNTYVWDGDGGFHAEEQQFASTVEHSIGGSFDMGFAMGGKASLAVGKVLVELSAYAKLSLTQTMNKTQTTSTGMELHVDLGGVESRRITDHRDYPLFPGEKVDRYRFMSFYLENNASHWHDFFNTVVDPEWLSSNDEEARALRQTRQALPNKVWRVLHRVTYVERPTLMGFGRQQAPVNELSDAMQELQVQVQELTTKVDKVQRTLDAQE